jgi:hypothetical protein
MACAAGFLCCATGCFHYRLAAVTPDGTALPPATEPQSVTLWSYAWGLVQPNVRPSTCQGNGVAEVTSSTNLGFVALTVVTLGLVSPLEVQWRCAKDNTHVGNDF